MPLLVIIALAKLQATSVQVSRFPQNPMLTPASDPSIGDNINGPSLIRVPVWVERPLGRYYLYFSHHAGKFIRLAYADQLSGPWTVHAPGTLRLEEARPCHDHVASPDMHVDEARREIVMYFHCPSGGSVDANGRVDINQQQTFIATSSDGLQFHSNPQPLGPAYFRVFHWGQYYYAIVRAGIFLRARAMRSPFEQGPTLIPADDGRLLRHAAVDLRGDVLKVYYSRIGDRPERILVSEIRLTSSWSAWQASTPVDVLTPEQNYEGADRPLETSVPDEAPGRVRQLRDPGIFVEDGKTYLLYSIAGESGIAIGELANR